MSKKKNQDAALETARTVWFTAITTTVGLLLAPIVTAAMSSGGC